jgi:hypothetical protein
LEPWGEYLCLLIEKKDISAAVHALYLGVNWNEKYEVFDQAQVIEGLHARLDEDDWAWLQTRISEVDAYAPH